MSRPRDFGGGKTGFAMRDGSRIFLETPSEGAALRLGWARERPGDAPEALTTDQAVHLLPDSREEMRQLARDALAMIDAGISFAAEHLYDTGATPEKLTTARRRYEALVDARSKFVDDLSGAFPDLG